MIHALMGVAALVEIVAALAGIVYAVGVLVTAEPATDWIRL